MKENIKKITFLIAVPLIVMVITHFAYISGYTEGVFSRETFQNQYAHDIYKYRILSNILIIELDKILSQSSLNSMDNMLTRIVKFMDNEGELSFYFSYFFLNSIFWILSVFFFYKILKENELMKNNESLYFAVTVYSAVIPLFQYVIVPYDYTSYFFNNVIIYLFIKNLSKKTTFLKILIILSIILATLNRETSALTISFMVAFLYGYSKKIKIIFKEISLPVLFFILTYFSLRIFLGFDSAIFNNFRLIENFISPLNLFGIFAGIVSIAIIYFFAVNKKIKNIFTLFLFFSSPYILVSLFSGVTYEIRLWTPLIINLSILLIYFRNRTEIQ